MVQVWGLKVTRGWGIITLIHAWNLYLWWTMHCCITTMVKRRANNDCLAWLSYAGSFLQRCWQSPSIKVWDVWHWRESISEYSRMTRRFTDSLMRSNILLCLRLQESGLQCYEIWNNCLAMLVQRCGANYSVMTVKSSANLQYFKISAPGNHFHQCQTRLLDLNTTWGVHFPHEQSSASAAIICSANCKIQLRP